MTARTKIVRRLAAVAAGTFAAFLLAEFVVVPRALDHPTLGRQAGFSPAMQVLAQSSKRGAVPEHYVLVLGDSNAAGFGDWIDGADKTTNPPYQATHVLHELTGRDVVTFGAGGAGSVPGLVALPIQRSLSLERRDLPEPDVVFAYFFEGNDLDNNLRYLARHWKPQRDGPDPLDDARFDAFLARQEPRWRLQGRLESIYSTSYAASLLLLARKERKRAERSQLARSSLADEDVARARIGDAIVPLAAHMQAPALELEDDERERALQVFERCLARLCVLYPNASLRVVYLPAPLSCYELVGDEVTVQSYQARSDRFPVTAVNLASDRTAARVSDICTALGVPLVDAKPALRAAARSAPVHGPGDWRHLNRRGYTALAELLAHEL